MHDPPSRGRPGTRFRCQIQHRGAFGMPTQTPSRRGPHVEHPLVQGHGRPQDAGHCGLMGRDVFGGGAKRRRARGLRHGPRLRQCAAQFTPHALHVPSEGGTVFVPGSVAQVQQKLACDAGRAVEDLDRHEPKVRCIRSCVTLPHANKSPWLTARRSVGAWTSRSACCFTSRANWRQVSGVWMLSGWWTSR